MRIAHRVHTSAAPALVWELVGDPERWPQFDLQVRRVRGARGSASPGDRLVGLSRLGSLRIPIDVVESVPPSRLVVVVHVAPGLREQRTVEVTSAVRGGCDVTVSVVLEGPLAPLAVLPGHLTGLLTARLLAARAERLARQHGRAA